MKLFNKVSRRLNHKLIKISSRFKFNLWKFEFSRNSFFILILFFSILTFSLGRNFSNFKESFQSNETFIHFINVGQGDAILLNNKNYNILIDSGSNESSDYLISYLKNFNIKKLNYVIATHPHEDHIGAMDDIVNNFHVDTFIAPNITTTDIDFINMVKALNHKNLKINVIEDNLTINLFNDNFLTFLWSGSLPQDNINNNSLVVKYINENISFLFTGDIEKEVEAQLQSIDQALISSDVLKVAHHGSNSSSTLNFLTAVDPNISVITCGIGNTYGHPHKNTLTNLNNINSSVYRTDIQGNIIIKTDGSKLWINTEHDN